MESRAWLELLERQAGVVARHQALRLGAHDNDLRRWVRQRRVARVHTGVYVDHTGRLSWLQQAWAGVLALSLPGATPEAVRGAALDGASAMRAACGPGSRWPTPAIHVVVDSSRRVSAPPGVRVRRVGALDEVVRWNSSPPRLTVERAVLAVAVGRDRLDAVADLSAAVSSRTTTAARLRHALDSLPRASDRRWLEQVIADIADGTCSALEHGYLALIERPHGLRGARRQVRDRLGSATVYRDVVYEGGLVVELDGRQHQESVHRDADLDRDLDAATTGARTVRLGWGQVFGRPCRTASRLAQLLPGVRATPCGPDCQVGSRRAA